MKTVVPLKFCVRAGAALLALLCAGGSLAASTCSVAGGTPGPNLFDNAGTFGTLPGSPATPAWAAALPAGRTTLTYINNKLRTSPYVGSPEDNEYTIANSTAFRTDGAWWVFTDHTGSASGAPSGNPNGLMMVINASFAPDTFYSQTLTVVPNTNYDYGLWLINMLTGAGINPNIQVEVDRIVNGVTLPTQIVTSTGDIPVTNPPTWKLYSSVINSGAATQMVVRFKNKNPGGGGNDLAMDDLTFTTCTGLSVGSLSGNVFLDANRNGVRDAATTDPVIAGVTVQLLSSSGTLTATATADATGYYAFYSVPAGTYTVQVQPGDPKVDPTYVATLPAGAVRAGTVIANGAFVTGQDFGYVQGADVQALKTVRLGSSGVFTSSLSVNQNAALQFQLTLNNAGTTSVTLGASLSDTLPAALSTPALVGAATASGGATGCAASLSGGVVKLSAATLPVSAACTVIFSASVPTAGAFTNTATASLQGGVPELNAANNSSSVSVTVLGPAVVSVSKRGRNLGPTGALTGVAFGSSLSVRPGDVLEYCLDYAAASGRQGVSSVLLRDPFPASLSALTSGYGAGLGLQWSRTLSGVGSVVTLTSVAGDDAGDLSAAGAVLRVGALASGDSGSLCFQAHVN